LTNTTFKKSSRNPTFNIQKVWSIPHDKVYVIFELGKEANFATSTKEKNNIYTDNILDFDFINKDNKKDNKVDLNHIIKSKKSNITVSSHESIAEKYIKFFTPLFI